MYKKKTDRVLPKYIRNSGVEAELSKRTRYTRRTVSKIMSAYYDLLIDCLRKNTNVTLGDIGIFRIRPKRGRKNSYDFHTKMFHDQPDKYIPFFEFKNSIHNLVRNNHDVYEDDEKGKIKQKEWFNANKNGGLISIRDVH